MTQSMRVAADSAVGHAAGKYMFSNFVTNLELWLRGNLLHQFSDRQYPGISDRMLQLNNTFCLLPYSRRLALQICPVSVTFVAQFYIKM